MVDPFSGQNGPLYGSIRRRKGSTMDPFKWTPFAVGKGSAMDPFWRYLPHRAERQPPLLGMSAPAAAGGPGGDAQIRKLAHRSLDRAASDPCLARDPLDTDVAIPALVGRIRKPHQDELRGRRQPSHTPRRVNQAVRHLSLPKPRQPPERQQIQRAGRSSAPRSNGSLVRHRATSIASPAARRAIVLPRLVKSVFCCAIVFGFIHKKAGAITVAPAVALGRRWPRVAPRPAHRSRVSRWLRRGTDP